jgi:NAD(P)-dependent dehydrogenase (short-subunit alcohol dehydrogenase family)
MSTPKIRFDGQVAIITGAGRGLGAAYAKLLASRGATVVVNDAGVSLEGEGGDQSVADNTASQIKSAGGKAIANCENLETREGCRRLVTFTLDALSRIDVLISNAGLLSFIPAEKISQPMFERFVKISVEAPFWLSQEVFPPMKRQRYGRIILTTSGRALYLEAAVPGLSAYSVGKAAQIGLMNALAVEGEEYGIRINAISPVAATRMLQRKVSPDEFKPEQVAPAVAFLASSACNFSGVVISAGNGKFRRASWTFGKEFSLGEEESSAVERFSAMWKQEML